MDEHVELHDGHVSRIEVVIGSHLLVDLDRVALCLRPLVVPRPSHAEGVERLSFEGRLAFGGEPYGPSDRVADARIHDAKGEVDPTPDALRSVADGTLEIECSASGSRLTSAAKRITFEITRVGERFDSFEEDRQR